MEWDVPVEYQTSWLILRSKCLKQSFEEKTKAQKQVRWFEKTMRASPDLAASARRDLEYWDYYARSDESVYMRCQMLLFLDGCM